MKRAKIRVSEIFTVLIFAVGESGTCGLASNMAKEMSRIAYNKKWQFKLFVPVQRGKYPRTQDVRGDDCFRSRPCAVWFVRLCLRGISISWIASAL